MSKTVDISHLQAGAEGARDFTKNLVSAFATKTSEAIEEVAGKIPSDYITAKADAADAKNLSVPATTAYVDTAVSELESRIGEKQYVSQAELETKNYVSEEAMKTYQASLHHATKTDVQDAIQNAIYGAIENVY